MNRPKTVKHKAKTVGATALALSAFAGAALPGSAAAPAAKADAALTQRLAAHVAGGVSAIVRLDGPLTPARQAQLSALGARVTARLPIIGSVTVSMPARSLGRLASLPFVTHLSYDGIVKKCDEFTTGSSGATTAWPSYSVLGTGVTVAVVDSGINAQHPDLQTPASMNYLVSLGLMPKGTRVVAGVSFVTDSTGKTLSPADQCGHGTHVAGIIGGDGAASYGQQYTHTFYGVAPLANLVSVRVLDAQGGGTVSTVVAGLQWVIQNQARYGIKVINLSLGHPVGESYTTDPLCQAVEAAWKAGIVVVCAAGNDGRLDSVADQPDNEGWGTAYGSISSPGNDPFVITVGAAKSTDGLRADDRIATYSSRGPSRLDLILKPDLVAPGNKVISLDAGNATLDQVMTNQLPLSAYSSVKGKDALAASKNYFVLSGTSMATPVVSGAAALLLQANPSLSPDTVKARLMLSADKPAAWCAPDGSYDPCTYGAGYLNIPAALSNSFTAVGEYAVSPSLSIDAGGNVGINDDHCLWGKTTVNNNHCLWGKSALWGSSGITDLHCLWGKNALAGSNTLASSHCLWGKSVWSDHSLWGASTSAVDLTNTALRGE